MLNCRATILANNSAVQPALDWMNENKPEDVRLNALAACLLNPHSQCGAK